jgi:hypothetical protein
VLDGLVVLGGAVFSTVTAAYKTKRANKMHACRNQTNGSWSL